MMKKFPLLLILCLAFCFSALADGITVTDMMGREVSFDAPVTRVVALTAADCEILCALSCEDALVGRGEYCDYPPSILDVPSVQSGMNTNIEEIIALEPQVILMSTMAQTTDQADAFKAAGIETVISDAQDIEGVYTAITLLGTLMGKETEAATLVAGMQDAFAEISAKSQETGKTVYFEVSPLQWGLWAAGSGTFMDELARMCGLVNAFADVDGWGQISEEQVIERDPDYIVTITMYFGEGETPVEEIMHRTGWENLKAVRNGDILNADSNEISRPGPRLRDAAETLYQFVYEKEALDPAA